MIVAYFLTIFNHFLNISFLCLSFPLEKLRITIEKFIRDNNFCVDVIPASGIFIYFLFDQATRKIQVFRRGRLTPIFNHFLNISPLCPSLSLSLSRKVENYNWKVHSRQFSRGCDTCIWNLYLFFIQSSNKEEINANFSFGSFSGERVEKEKNLRGSNGAVSKISYFLSRDLLVNRWRGYGEILDWCY